MNDIELRHAIYQTFADTGRAPSRDQAVEWTGDEGALQRLHDAHSLVLDDSGEILMALPFSAVATDFMVISGDRSWWANCAWDSLAIPVALGVDAEIEATWMDTGEPVDLRVSGGVLSSVEGFVHFAVPARHWWADIVET
ncbi:MAG: alkylmercury lyase family protein [Acidimicrobiia bacterium]|nr:alkylmercury lyase family protein [Acidimicrobiia bacterium]NNC75751.1 hypothetical protein [Acidimicrobiia bacterium]